jgi:hypothetical protein
MRLNRIQTLGLALLALTLALPARADWWDNQERIDGEGSVQSESREISSIEAVELGTIGTLFIEQGPDLKLTVQAEENLLQYLRTDVRRKTLVIRTEHGVSLRPHKSIEYHLTVPQLEEVDLSSSGDAVMGDWKADRLIISLESSGDMDCGVLTCPRLDIQLESSGDLYIDEWEGEKIRASLGSSGDLKIGGGHAKEQDIEISSSGDYQAPDLQTETATVRVSSSGDAKVRVSDYLYARTSSSGDIIYYGRPKVDSDESSSGDVTRGER